MSPEEAQQVIHQWVYSSAFQIASNHPLLPNHHEVCVQNICHALFGPEWNNYTPDEQWAKRWAIWGEYHGMLTNYLPVIRQFLQDTNEILRLDEVTLSAILRRASPARASAAMTTPTKTTATNTTVTKTTSKKTNTTQISDAINKPAAEESAGCEESDDEILKTKAAIERDEAARRNLDKYYDPCQQGRKDLMIRRAKEPEGNIDLFNYKDIPLNDDNRTKNCPECGKAITSNGIKRHYQITHEKDPRWVIYCPAPGCKFECWRGDATILTHMAYHHEDLHRKTFGQEDVQKQAVARDKAREKVNARARKKANARRAEKVKAEAKSRNSAISDVDEQIAEDSKLAEDQLRVETPEYENMHDENLYDDDMEDDDMDDDDLDDEDMDDEELDDEDLHDEARHNRSAPNQHMSIQNMLNPDTQELYVPSQPMPNQPMSGQYMPDQYMPGQYMPGQYMPGQYMPRQYIPGQYFANQHMPGQYIPGQDTSNQLIPNEYIPNQYLSNHWQYSANQYMSNKQMANERMPNEHLRLEDTSFDFTIGNAGDGHFYHFDQQD